MTNMGHISYNRFRNSRPHRGFRVNPRRFSVSRLLRARFVCLFKFLRCSYGQALQCLRKSMGRNCPGTSSPGTNYGPSNIKRNSRTSSRRSLVSKEMKQNKGRSGSADFCRLRSFGRSNSFYAEAIADCLEFIKRSSVSVDQNP
ncbi:unnamed protein product [Malus baccata var. baccata]|uniref:Uncharacterized protein n=1 Tax=Malus domestica TaxID=3750 RepID=A0A498KLR9_MALDO|nr:hypothetical protein DVH24_018325 [Malus domestica]